MDATRHVSYDAARGFLKRCFAKPARMRLLCSTKAGREGGEALQVTVELGPGGPVVQVREVSMADGWTGCRFSPSALWLALQVADPEGPLAAQCGAGCGQAQGRPKAIEFGCGVALAGLAAHAMGYDTTLTDCLPGHLKNLQSLQTNPVDRVANPAVVVRRLDWLLDVGHAAHAANQTRDAIDRGSPENLGEAESDWPNLEEEQLQSFDLALASDVVYEPHHAILLPMVISRWLKPGGWWAVALAIRDEEMCCRFVEQLDSCGLYDPEHLYIQTACVPERCCKRAMRDLPSSELTTKRLCDLVRAHEGGAVLLQGQRPEDGKGEVVPEEEKRLARWNLKRAMHDRRIADIEKALIAGEECHLYPMELEHARHTLLEARKADALYRLEKTLSDGEIAAIRAAIDKAAEAGVNASKLQSAEKVLEDVKKQEDARMLLHEAGRTANIAQLRQALEDSVSLGLEEHELHHLRRRLSRLERKVEAQEKLQAAIAGHSISALTESIALASTTGLPAAELDKARKALKDEQQKAAARVILKDARLGKKASPEGRISDLHDALKGAKSAGLTEEEMQGAQVVLDQLVMQVAARRALQEAVELATIDALKPAIEDARAAGIDSEEVKAAEVQLENAYKPTARLKLKEAIQSRDIPTILAAIEQGKAVGLSVMAIAEASEIVQEEELRIQLRKRLAKLYASKNLQELKAAINLGQTNGLKEEELNDARKQVAELEEQEALCQRISEAIQGGEIVQIKAMIAEAEEVRQRVLTPCVPPELIQDAEKALKHEIESAAQSMLMEAATGLSEVEEELRSLGWLQMRICRYLQCICRCH
ncbi:unnamed protein product [Durusdinium trenchii]|uniref:Calmodulin-lysine N-methyltransferase n=1 Tax=Durusdinium trenchii TaxID=1381693 RepID=A0ABP0I0P3_9DINO